MSYVKAIDRDKRVIYSDTKRSRKLSPGEREPAIGEQWAAHYAKKPSKKVSPRR
jgi:hypothetical protein